MSPQSCRCRGRMFPRRGRLLRRRPHVLLGLQGRLTCGTRGPMTPRRSRGFVRMPDAEFAAILTRAAEECDGSAKRALAVVCLDGDEPALDKLQALRDRPGKPPNVRSAHLSPEHNRAVSGASRSKHLDGAAFDIAMTNHDAVPSRVRRNRRRSGGPATRRARVRSCSSASARARGSSMSISAPRGKEASGFLPGRRPSSPKRRPGAKCWPRAAP